MHRIVFTLFASASLFFAAAVAAQAQSPRYAPAPPELLKEVVRRHPLPQGAKPRYGCAWLDLNGDRVDEAILWSPGNEGDRLFDSGNRYDGFEVYQKTGKTYKYLGGGLYSRDNDQIGVLTTRTGKWRDLASYSFTFGDEKLERGNYWFRCRYGAKGYSSDAVELKAPPKIIINRAQAPTYPL